MSAVAAFKALPGNELSSRETELLRHHLDDLARFLGSPGDWGYGTKMGELTQIVRAQLDEIRS
jgi:hypothetical protein